MIKTDIIKNWSAKFELWGVRDTSSKKKLAESTELLSRIGSFSLKNYKGPLPPFNLSLGYYGFSLADHFGYTLYLYITIALSTTWFTFAISWGTFRSASPVSKFRQIFLNFIKHVEIWTLPHESTESKIHKFTCNFSKFVNYKLQLKC